MPIRPSHLAARIDPGEVVAVLDEDRPFLWVFFWREPGTDAARDENEKWRMAKAEGRYRIKRKQCCEQRDRDLSRIVSLSNHHSLTVSLTALLTIGPVFTTTQNIEERVYTTMTVGASAATSVLVTRSRALSLYRQLLRGASKMPTPNRVRFVTKKTRSEFKANLHLVDPAEIEFCLRLADTNLDTVLIQAEHLTRLMKDPNYLSDV